MRSGGGHSKGAEFERVIAKDIVKAFKKFGVVQRDCWRSVMSGGHSMSSGDLEMTPKMEKLFPFSVECKFHKKIEWWRYIIHSEYTMKSWKELLWQEQAWEGAKKRKGLLPLLVMKENRGDIFAMYPVGMKDVWVLMKWRDFLKKAVAEAKGNG